MIPDVFKLLMPSGYTTRFPLSKVREVVTDPEGGMRVFLDDDPDDGETGREVLKEIQDGFIRAWTSYMMRVRPQFDPSGATLGKEVVDLLRRGGDEGWNEGDLSIAQGIVDFHDRMARGETDDSSHADRILETLNDVRRRLSQRGPESAAERIQGAIGEIADLDKAIGKEDF